MSHKVFRSLFVLTLILGLAAMPASQPAQAAGPWYVSTTGNDANDCLSPATPCATINGALNKPDFVAGDTILVAIGTYTGTGNEVVLLDKDAILSGGWDETFTTQSGMSTIDGQGARRGLTVAVGPLSVTTVEAFIIQNGSAFDGGGISNSGALTLNNSTVSCNSTAFGGGISNIGALTLNNTTVSGNLATTFGGGINNSGVLTLNNSTVSGNSSTTFGGGGIANSGALTLNNSTVSGNSTTSSGGGIINSGGISTLTLNNSTVSGNSAASSGGGIANFSGTVTLNDSLVTLNTSAAPSSGPPGGGGGIANNNGGAITLNNSAVNGNSAANLGGGIFNNAGSTVTLNNSVVSNSAGVSGGGIFNYSILTLTNSTVNGNSATFVGGGLFNGISGGVGGTLTLNNSTVSGNNSNDTGGGVYNTGTLTLNNITISSNNAANSGGLQNDGVVAIQNTLVAKNTAGSGPDCRGNAISSSGYNLIGDTTNCDFTATPDDLINVDPHLGQLIGPSGAPRYHPLLSGSPAIDAGNPAGCSDRDGNPLTTDQRGVARPQGARCDIGAYEYTTPGPAASLAVADGNNQSAIITFAFPKPLQAAALDSQGSPVGGVTIDFTAPGSGPSGIFADTSANTTSVTTDEGGTATTSIFTANDQAGAYTVSASATGLGSVNFSLEQFLPPTNDNFANVKVIASLPFSATADITDFTNEPDEQQFCYFMGRTAWYSFTPAETMLVRANTQGSAINGNVNIYRAAGPGISDLQFLSCTGPADSPNFIAEANQTYYLQAGSAFDEVGSIQINLAQVPHITGRVTDAVTGNPLPGDAPPFTEVSLYRCDVSGCLEFITFQNADSQGRFRFTYDQFGAPLPAGTYQVQVSARQYQANQAGPFDFADTILDLGDIPLTPLPAITGRAVDAVTGSPLPGDAPPFALVTLFRCDEFGCFEFVNQQQADSNGRFRFTSYYYGTPLPTGTYQIEVSASLYLTKQVGPFSFVEGQDLDLGDIAIVPSSIIRGRVVDANTGNPLPGDAPPFASVALRRCDVSGCFEFVNSQNTDGSGQFQFNSFPNGQPLTGGTYELEIAAGPLYEIRRLEVVIGDGENRDLGDVPLAPLPRIGSISGQIIDSVTGKPVPAAFAPFVHLNRCNEFGCFNVNSEAPDTEGRFRFEIDSGGNPLVIGTYQVVAFADQYEPGQTDLFDVGEGEHRVVDVRLKSFPVRFSDIRPCADLPATGGDCVYSVKITNGLATELEGAAWSVVDSNLPGSFAGFTNFQTREPREIEIASGKSKVLQFRFRVPANNSPFGTSVCAQAYVGQGSRPLFNTVGQRFLFCVFRGATGFTAMTPEALQASLQQPQAAEPTRLLSVALSEQVVTAANGTDAEPNGTCATAQDVGAVTLPFTLDGVLDSAQSPDVDFFRFTGTPNALVRIDLEGASTGKGTLGDPFLGFFDSSCNVIALDDDSGEGPNSRLQFNIPPDGVYVLGATICCDAGFGGGGNGSYQLTITPVIAIGSISGRIVDSKTGDFLPGDAPPFTFVRLLHCTDSGCSEVNNQNADSLGQFRFERDFSGSPLLVGTYQIQISANVYLPGQTDPFFVGEAEHLDLGNIPLPPEPAVGSISGRITDAVTGQSLRGDATPFAFVRLLQCDEFGCFDVNGQATGSDGRFHFDRDFNGAPLRVGNYLVAVSADQYQPGQTEPFAVGEDENRDMGDAPLQSYPVRFSNIQTCVIPSGGGICEYAVTITNGMPTRLSGKTWSIVDGSGLGSFAGVTRFQTSDPLDVSVDAGKSKVVRFRFQVPGTVPDGATICTQVFVGQGGNAFFNTVGQRFLFCFVKGSTGFTLLSEQEAQAAFRQLQTPEAILPETTIEKKK